MDWVFHLLFRFVEFSVFHYFRYQVRGCVIFAGSFISVMALGRPKDNYLRKSLFDNLVGISLLSLYSWFDFKTSPRPRRTFLHCFDSLTFVFSTEMYTICGTNRVLSSPPVVVQVSHKRAPDLYRFSRYSLFGQLCSVSFFKFCLHPGELSICRPSSQAGQPASADLIRRALTKFTQFSGLRKYALRSADSFWVASRLKSSSSKIWF